MLGGLAGVESVEAFLTHWLPEIGAELKVSWAALFRRSPEWQLIAESGRNALAHSPHATMERALVDEAAGWEELDSPLGWSLMAIPLDDPSGSGFVAVFAGQALAKDRLPTAMILGRTLGNCLGVRRHMDRLTRQKNLLQNTLQIAAGFSAAKDTPHVLELIADGATRLLKCDRASIFIWDRNHHQVIACPALGVESGTLRLPDTTGIVGKVIHSGETICVENAYQDSRFDQSVDEKTGYRTRTILCVPLRDREDRLIGAFQALNKHQGTFADEDGECLSQLGLQASMALRTTQERDALVRSHQVLTEQLTGDVELVGENPAIVAMRKTLERLAETDLPVLVLGESGTGKEVVAQSLHYRSPRSRHPFVAVNCAALTESLLESELFGHERGAFTDAHETRQGKFEIAEGGTVFLDEIGDMSPAGQAKLLRVLEQKVISRVGGSAPIPIDVRVVAATNTDLLKAVREKRFREDLYYRLNVVTIDLPPLRDRPEDILPLAEHFLRRFSPQAGRPILDISPDAARRLQTHTWPGNVRELRNLMERLAFLSATDQIEPEDLGFLLTAEEETDQRLTAATRRFQQEYIRRAIKRSRGNMTDASKLLGLHRSNLYRKMKQLGMGEADDEELASQEP